MKKNIAAICLLGAALMASCGGTKPSKPVFKDKIDTVSYCFAMARTNGFIEYLTSQMGVDTTYMNDFAKGFMEAAATKPTNGSKTAYLAGIQIGDNEVNGIFKQIGAQLFGSENENRLNLSNYVAGFIDGTNRDFAIFNREKAGIIADSLFEIIYTESQNDTLQNEGAVSRKISKAVFNDRIDTISYCMAMARTNGFIEYLTGQMGVDSTYMKNFFKGFMEVARTNPDNKSKKAYYAGLQIGQSEIGNTVSQLGSQLFGPNAENGLNVKNYIAGFIDGAKGNFKLMDRQKATNIADSLYSIIAMEQQEIQAQKRAAEFAGNRAEGEAFLAEKAKEDGIIALESGVLYKVLEQGNGAIPTAADKVHAIYEGRLIDGTVFDSSEEGIDFPVMGVIKGWQEVLQLMPEGSKWQVYIPQELAYGERETGKIKPYSALVFDITLVNIVK